MPTMEVNADIEVWCGECGEDLYQETHVSKGNIHVDPCPACRGKKQDEINILETQLEKCKEELSELKRG
jgi:Zn-finger nucleic acid-binding protein